MRYPVREDASPRARRQSDATLHLTDRRRPDVAVQTLHPIPEIRPGSRYRATDPTSPIATSELVIDRLVRDDLGMLHVVLLDLEGREISLFAEQFEAAVASGFLAPALEPARAYA
jgi:hypothetical protein